MNTTEANIKLILHGERITSVSVNMPIWAKESGHGNLLIRLPLLGIETIARHEQDSEAAIEEAIISFCMVAQKFGQGIEKELQSLGWVKIDGETGEIYRSGTELAKHLGTKRKYITRKLNGERNNNTPYRYL